MERMNFGAQSLWALLWLIGRLPLRAQHVLGDALAILLRLLRAGPARIARRNLELAWPELQPTARDALHRASLRETGRTVFETVRFWTRPASTNLALIREVEGEASFEAALAQPQGVIIAAPHLGNWELLNQWLASRTPMAIVYRPPRQAWIEDVLRRARGHEGVTQVRAEAAGVRELFRTLKRGGAVGILPDQQPKAGEGEFTPFFGVPALTMTLLSRLASKSGATVLFAWAERLPDAAGFRVRISPAAADIAATDTGSALIALNAGIEDCVRIAPAQYQWSYKRYAKRPEGAPRRY
jgi:KDO2-lipid IV(A) lauroyltransferase